MNFIHNIIYYSNITYYNRIVNRENRKNICSFKKFHVKHWFLFLPIYNNEGKENIVMLYVVTGGFIVLDMVTGLVKAFKEKGFKSQHMREGLFHKCGSILTVVFGLLVDYAQTLIDLGVTIPITLAFCSYIILMECGSIIENVGKINPEIIPAKIKPYFSKLTEGE